MLKKEILDLKRAIKKWLKVSDVKRLDEDEEEVDQDELEELLKIAVTKAGEKAIEKEYHDIERLWKKIEHSRSVRNVENSIKRWVKSK